MRQPGSASGLLRRGESAGQLITKGERQTSVKESDGTIVPISSGNSAE